MKKILLCANSLRGGGSERQLFLLASALVKDYQLLIFSLNGGYYFDKLSALDIPIVIFPRKSKYDTHPFRELRKVILSFKPDVIHSWDWMQVISTYYTCKTHSIALVSGFIRTGRIPPKTWLGMLFGSRIADITISNSLAGFKAFHLGTRDRVIYNGIDTNMYPSTNDVQTPPMVCTMCASFLPSKDHASVFAAVEELSTSNRFRFILAGKGPLYSKYKFSYKHLIDSGIVQLPGFVEDISGLMANTHVGILLSNAYEGISNSIMEYMASGLPVIATKRGGNPELIAHGQNGYLIAPGDWKSLVRYLQWFSDNPKKRHIMGENARVFISSNFSIDRMVSQTIDAYKYAIKSIMTR